MGFIQRMKEAGTPAAYRRKVEGTPAGGQFDAQYHSEVTFDLTLDEQRGNADATWEVPPYPSSAAQIIDFWSNIEVPTAVVEMAVDQTPIALHPATAKTLVRCEMMLRTVEPMTDDVEALKVLRYPVRFPDGKVFAPRDALDWYGAPTTIVGYERWERRPEGL
jgi:hypothetical protein